MNKGINYTHEGQTFFMDGVQNKKKYLETIAQ